MSHGEKCEMRMGLTAWITSVTRQAGLDALVARLLGSRRPGGRCRAFTA